MENLPVEILTQILKYLNIADRREFALVSKKLYEATLDPTLYTKETFVFDAQALLATSAGLSPDDEQVFCCKSPNLVIEGLEENLNVKTLLHLRDNGASILGPHVWRLTLKRSSILQGSLVEILRQCESLEALDLTGSGTIFMAGPVFAQTGRYEDVQRALCKLQHLCLASIRHLTDASLKTFFNLCPELKSISLASCNLLFSEFGRTQRFALTFHNFCELVTMRNSTLTRIDLSRTGLSNESLRELSSIKGLRLEEVVFQNCRELGDSGLVALVKKQRGLRVIDVRGCYDIGDQSLSAICCCTLDVRELYLAKCRKITDAAASKISTLSKLRLLDISECFNLTMATIGSIVNSLDRLHTLHANGCNLSKLESTIPPGVKKLSKSKVTDQPSKTIKAEIPPAIPWSPTYKNLTDLNISSGKYVTDLTIQCIFVHMTSLHRLSLSWCPYVTDAGLLGLDVDISRQQMFPMVENAGAHILSSGRFSTTHGRTGFLVSPGSEFKLDSYVDWNEQDIKACMLARGIARLRSLRRLSLSNCGSITDESLIRIFCTRSYFPQMEYLELNMLKAAVTDDVLNGISMTCPLMRSLSLSSTQVSDAGVGYITSRLHRLEVLKLSNCDLITSRFFTNLSKHARWLRELDISSCKQIQPSSANLLAKGLPLLTKIHTRFSGDPDAPYV